MTDSGRDLRIADFIRDELAAIIQREMRDPRVGIVNVNEVKVSRDRSYADVYVSSLQTTTVEDRAELISVLNKAAGFFRSELAKRHSMRTTPKIRVHYDELIESGPRLEALIQKAVKADEDAASRSGSPEGGSAGNSESNSERKEDDRHG
jgi:ribosome-binding factor A